LTASYLILITGFYCPADSASKSSMVVYRMFTI
jgi:hypothetical protein